MNGPCTTTIISQEVVLSVDAAPQADFTFNLLGNNTFQFNNNSTNATSFQWDFGDGEISNETAPSHTYQNDGVYVVELTAFNGCDTISFTQTVNVQALPSAAFSSDVEICLLYTSPSPRDRTRSRMPSSA